jgi:hypothetical protein
VIPEQPLSDETLAAFVEGVLPDDEAAAIERVLRESPQDAARVESLRRILAEPFQLEPVEPPAALRTWVREQARERAESADDADLRDAPAYDDVLGEDAFVLEPVEVPADLEGWVRATVAEHAASDVREGDDRAGVVVAFPLLATPARAAAALLAVLGAGLLLGLSLRQAPQPTTAAVDTAELDAARARLSELESLLEAREQAIAAAHDERDGLYAERDAAREAARLSADEQRTLRDQLAQSQTSLDEQRSALAQAAEARAQLQARLDARAPGADRLAQLELALAEAQLKTVETLERAEALAAQVDALQADLASLDRGPEPTITVATATQLERWDERTGWRTLTAGEELPVGAIVRGAGLNSRLGLGQSTLRVGQGLYLLEAEGLRALPQGRPAADGLGLARAQTRYAEPRGAQGVQATVAPLSGLFR